MNMYFYLKWIMEEHIFLSLICFSQLLDHKGTMFFKKDTN